ncbi:hypothetical protein CAPTEDRAFT_224794 [Capitella teleta]|uniref:PID domain-containing protein n=1 Tax=Capitella teleta TaxID=283909 RepID=R7VBD7_CAPTE|nr:hypothetical protein CAPTEDRAFT_224794 [Capitella teleta]|eukprot:ELU13621.1 hypothetical protein CAPTEDRAFT_224794 [Capitella teleta]
MSRPESWYLDGRADAVYESADILSLARAMGSESDTTLSESDSEGPAEFRYWMAAPYVGSTFDEKSKDINSPDSNDSGIQADVQHVSGPVNEDLYAVVKKKGTKEEKKEEKEKDEEEKPNNCDDSENLPCGWEKHEDERGPYYWHIKSGTIQRNPPLAASLPDLPQKIMSASMTSSMNSSMISTCSFESYSSIEPQHSNRILEDFDPFSKSNSINYQPSEEIASSDDSSPTTPTPSGNLEYPIRFAVRSLGWVNINESDLTPERSSKAVNKCIVDLSLGKNDLNDVVGRWGDGKDLFMDLDEQTLTLIDPQDMSVLNIQPIHSIRVWGVGRDNGRDFAYVARDRGTREHMCHVFRCDTPARQIANTLRDICKQIMLQRNLTNIGNNTANGNGRGGINRPNNLPNLEKVSDQKGQTVTFEGLLKSTSFPTPMEEPKKVLRCHYLGTANVNRPTGVDTLNNAMEKVYEHIPREKWVFASVAVAPSTITVTEHKKPDNVLAECRVRFLSFMGIAMENVKLCAFIMHTAQDSFIAHVFHCEPSGGALCKTIEAACKLRYQKCLDAHTKQFPGARRSNPRDPSSKGLGASLKQGVQSMFRLKAKRSNLS